AEAAEAAAKPPVVGAGLHGRAAGGGQPAALHRAVEGAAVEGAAGHGRADAGDDRPRGEVVPEEAGAAPVVVGVVVALVVGDALLGVRVDAHGGVVGARGAPGQAAGHERGDAE